MSANVVDLLHSQDRHDIVVGLRRLRAEDAPADLADYGASFLVRLCELTHSWDNEVQRLSVRAIEDVSGKHSGGARDEEMVQRRATADLSSQQAIRAVSGLGFRVPSGQLSKLLLTRENLVLGRLASFLEGKNGPRQQEEAVVQLKRLVGVNPLFNLHMIQHVRCSAALDKLARNGHGGRASLMAREVWEDALSAVDDNDWVEVTIQQRLCLKVVAALAYLSQDPEQERSVRSTTSKVLASLNCSASSPSLRSEALKMSKVLAKKSSRAPTAEKPLHSHDAVPLMVAVPQSGATSHKFGVGGLARRFTRSRM
eukprot:INCI16328.1.p1 GENE.INCI16328.1~~INCI16328.1.p1  ORF type:complete len:312 (-),score=44.42 INCI16328.1:775-1710(-)